MPLSYRLLSTVLLLLVVAVPVAARDNFLILLLDDIGVDQIGAYSRDDLYGHPGEGAHPGPTPNIDALAAEGVLFRNAWSQASCSPTRAQLLTGRHAFRTGIGSVGPDEVLDPAETTIAEMLASTHESAALGKWHVGGMDADHPNASGFDYYSGHLRGTIGDYFSWDKTTNGVTVSGHSIYATTDNVNEAIAAIEGFGANPWLVWVAFNAPHAPFHVPPPELHTQESELHTDAIDAASNRREKYRAMVEAVDTEVGRLLASLPPDVYDDTTIFVIGDNGTPRAPVQPPFLADRAKNTIYEGGINVPFVVRSPRVGPQAQGRESLALIGTVDVFATISEVAGAGASTEDSHSIVPYLEDPSAPTRAARPFVFAEQFFPNGAGPYTSHEKAVRDETYKLIWRDGVYEELYNLTDDCWEQTNLLLGTLTPSEQAAYAGLVVAMESVDEASPVSVLEGVDAPPSGLQLTARPNPFQAGVTVSFVLPAKTHVSMTVHDVAGRTVATIADGELGAGSLSFRWNGRGAATGTYFVRLVTDTITETRRVTLVR